MRQRSLELLDPKFAGRTTSGVFCHVYNNDVQKEQKTSKAKKKIASMK